MKQDPFNLDCLSLYVSCLSQMGKSNELFVLAHDLVDKFPQKAFSFYAIATYYFTIGKYLEARNYYSKATMMDPNFGAAWIGFAHSFSLEEEHDQALSAYSTAARILPGYFV